MPFYLNAIYNGFIHDIPKFFYYSTNSSLLKFTVLHEIEGVTIWTDLLVNLLAKNMANTNTK